ncbi:site-2 protease family protein [Cerasicoccus arenae]|uniref:PDZ domain-containing protein n=1 Tax=Cerasicoccus arenae TaxID=424488 RepID=A0A8J3DKG7_9BACT|nr:site-2 protease family protein [Cerasicoccus arenae]MBK1857813.1 site-2 protease family protein [Cerasicoccus arenae]GHC11727.1 hypothetical protein GCM10007047_31300 [Cerasicoccus arenae]
MADSTFFETLFTSAWGILLVLIFFNGSIIVHELGHFLAARWRGLKVDRFSLFGLGPKLISWKAKDGVEYCICAIPFGAYVALPQMGEMRGIEEYAEGDTPPPPISYADKMYVAFAGPFFNFILAIIVACIGWYTGYPSYAGSESAQIGYVAQTLDDEVAGPAYVAGLLPGDTILAIDGEPISSFKEVPEHVALGTGRDDDGRPQTIFKIDRSGQTQDVVIYPELILNNTGSGDRIRMIGIGPTSTMTISGVAPNSPAAEAGLQANDKILTVGGESVYSIEQISDILAASFREKLVPVEVERDGALVILEAKALPVPTTRPTANLFLPDSDEPAFEIIPSYPLDLKEDPALAQTPSRLTIFSLEPGESFFSAQGDWRIDEIDGRSITSLAQLEQVFQNDSAAAMTLTLARNDNQIRKRVLPALSSLKIIPPQEQVMLGFGTMPGQVLIHQNPIAQFKEHIQRTFRTLTSLVSPQSDIGMRHLSGVVGITTNLYKIAQYDWRMVFWFAVLLNINLAILNLLPIPVLDGGHMLFATINKLCGKAVPTSFIYSLQYVFVFLLLGVMFYVLYYDSMREVGYHEDRQKWEREGSRMIPREFRPDRYMN